MNYNGIVLAVSNHSETSFMKKSITAVMNGNLDASHPKQTEYDGLENTVLRNHQKTLLYHS